MQKDIAILLVEDDADDVDLFNEALQENEINYTMKVITEGDEAFQYMSDLHSLPDIIVLDLNLPKTDGKELLTEMKSLSKLSNVPVVVMTTSSSTEDIEYCRRMGSCRYLVKPVTMEGWNDAIRDIVSVAGQNGNGME